MHLQKVKVREADYGDASRWDEYITFNKDGLAYHFFSWKRAVENSYGFDCPYFLAEEHGRIIGVLPTVHVHPPLSKGQLVSLPYCDAGGIIADSPRIAKNLFNHACQYAKKIGISKIELRYPSQINTLGNSDDFSDKKNPHKRSTPEVPSSGKVRMLLELPEASEILLASFKSKLRSQVKKPGRDGLISELGGIELLEDFYTVFAENMHDLGSPVHSKKWLGNVLKYYKDQAKCGVVFMPDHTPAAAGIILFHDRIVSIPWASSLKYFNRFSPNMLLYWSFLKFSADNGYRFFDFGRSTPDEGTYKFKAQWGAQPQPLYWEQWKIEKNGVYSKNSGTISNSNSKSRNIAEKIIQKIPMPVATFLGSRLRKYISL